MADITNLFRATVKTVKARQKAQGVNVGTATDKSILPSSKPKSQFASKAKDVVLSIGKLREFLLQHRKDYINSSSLLGRDASKMTDAERDQIDADAQTFMRTCSEAIKVFKKDSSSNKVLPQVKEHREVVFRLVEGYLKEVCTIYSEQRAIRVKRVVERKKIGRLEPEKRHYESFASRVDKTEKSKAEEASIDAGDQKRAKLTSSVPEIEQPPIVLDEEDDLSPEETQMFEQENDQLYREMNSLVDEVKQVEGKVVEISRLQEVFTSKVLEQEVKIDHISDTVAGATDNIKDANEEIREAMKNNAGLRVWILFFLIVCSFSLLFLDWYNA